MGSSFGTAARPGALEPDPELVAKASPSVAIAARVIRGYKAVAPENLPIAQLLCGGDALREVVARDFYRLFVTDHN